jgi:hypothetical protein
VVDSSQGDLAVELFFRRAAFLFFRATDRHDIVAGVIAHGCQHRVLP